MAENIDQSSFASILAGVQEMRRDYDVIDPEQTTPSAPTPAPATSAPEKVARAEASVSSNTTVQLPVPGHNVGASDRGIQTATSTRTNRRQANGNVHSYSQVQVANSQKGNPLLESPQMKLTPWSYNAQILSDYYVNATAQVLFLSLKYHKLRPEYVWRRLEKIRGGSSSATTVDIDDQALRVLLVVVDIDSPQEVLRKLSVICVKNDLTMVVAWSFEEAGNYVAALKANEHARSKIESAIQGTRKNDYNSNIVDTLTAVRAVNKTDVANLLANCKSFKSIVLQATSGDGLSGIQGLGERKVANLSGTFSDPFIFNKEWK